MNLRHIDALLLGAEAGDREAPQSSPRFLRR
jgi:hypothetical protein